MAVMVDCLADVVCEVEVGLVVELFPCVAADDVIVVDGCMGPGIVMPGMDIGMESISLLGLVIQRKEMGRVGARDLTRDWRGIWQGP